MSLTKMAELDALQAEVDGLKRLQAETAGELEALFCFILPPPASARSPPASAKEKCLLSRICG